MAANVLTTELAEQLGEGPGLWHVPSLAPSAHRLSCPAPHPELLPRPTPMLLLGSWDPGLCDLSSLDQSPYLDSGMGGPGPPWRPHISPWLPRLAL